MSRSGYCDDYGYEDPLALGRWRQAVRRALEGKRGQAFLRETLAALDAMPEKRLITGDLVRTNSVLRPTEDWSNGCCTLGAVALARGVDTTSVDPHERDEVAALFGIAPAMAAEISFENDEHSPFGMRNKETPEQRWQRMRAWVASKIKSEPES